MTSYPSYRTQILGLLIVFLSVFPTRGFSDARTDYLLDMLQNGKNYRLREQAATTLGKLRATEAVDALVKATRDSHELVIISAAIALKQIGDGSVVDELEKSLKAAPSKAARSQLRVTLAVLKDIQKSGRPGTSAKRAPRFLVRIDAMGNSSRERRFNLVETMRKIVIKRIDEEPDIIVQQAGMTEGQIRSKLKKEKLAGYIVSGSIIQLEKSGNSLTVKLGLNVFTNPDYNLLMMPTTQATMSLDTGSSSPEAEKSAITTAIETVTDSLVGSVFSRLRQADL